MASLQIVGGAFGYTVTGQVPGGTLASDVASTGVLGNADVPMNAVSNGAPPNDTTQVGNVHGETVTSAITDTQGLSTNDSIDLSATFDANPEPAGLQPAINGSFRFGSGGPLTLKIVGGPGEADGTPVEVDLSGSVTLQQGNLLQRSDASVTASYGASLDYQGKTTSLLAQGSHTLGPTDRSFTTIQAGGGGGFTLMAKVGDTFAVDFQLSGTAEVTSSAYLDMNLGFNIFPLPPTVEAGTLAWNPGGVGGGATYTYVIQGGGLSAGPTLSFFWSDQPNLQGRHAAAATDVTGETQEGTHRSFLFASEFTPPPTWAKYLLMSVDSGENGIVSVPYNPDNTTFRARFDGDPSNGVIGRFFQGIPFAGQSFTFKLDDSLAALRPDSIAATLGGQTLAATPSVAGAAWDHETYTIARYDGTGGLAPGAHLVLTASRAGQALATSEALIDIVPTPTWVKSLKVKGTFDPATATYRFPATPLDVSTGTLSQLAVAASLWYGPAAKNGLDAKVALEVDDGLDQTLKPTLKGSADIKLTYLGRDLADLHETLAPGGGGKFAAVVQFVPRTLQFQELVLSYNDEVDRADLPLFPPKTTVGKGPFELVPSFHAKGIVARVGLTLAVRPDGSLDAGRSTLSLLYHSGLAGNIQVAGFNIHVPTAAKVALKITKALANTPLAILQTLISDYLSLTAEVGVGGSIDLTGHVGLSGSAFLPSPVAPHLSGTVALATRRAEVDLHVAKYGVKLFEIDLSDFLNIHRAF